MIRSYLSFFMIISRSSRPGIGPCVGSILALSLGGENVLLDVIFLKKGIFIDKNYY